MAVLHLEAGHVVGVVAVGGRVPTVAEATGGSHVRVLIPGEDTEVRVPEDLLSALAVDLDRDVLAQPTSYRVSESTPPVVWVGAPTAWPGTPDDALAGREALSVWDGAAEPEVVRETLDADGDLTVSDPPGQRQRLIAVEGQPLRYET